MSTQGNLKSHVHIDWLISNLRWLLLLGVALVIFLDAYARQPDVVDLAAVMPQIIILVIAIVYNIAIMILLSSRSTSRLLPILTLGIDTLFTVGLIVSSGGLTSQLLFFVLFPILTAALRFPQPTSVLVAVVFVSSFGGASYILAPETDWADFMSFAVVALVLVVAAVVSGMISERMKRIVAGGGEGLYGPHILSREAAQRHSRLTFELASALSATLNYDRVLTAALEVGEKGIRELGRETARQIGAVLLFTQSGLRFAASRHLSPGDDKVALQGNEGAIGQALAAGEALVIDDPADDEALGNLRAMRTCRQAMVLPLRAGFETFGVVLFGSSEAGLYTEDLQNLLVAVCNQTIVALQNAKLYQSLRQEKELIVAVEENARKKLARSLHDGPTQSVASIAMQVNYVQRLIENGIDPGTVSRELRKIEDLARGTTKEIRHMLFTLRPLILETQGLQMALEQYVSKLEELNGVALDMQVDPQAVNTLQREAQGVVFYILEEAISNARKHSEADEISVRLRLEDDAFVAEVEDDGSGFDVEAVQSTYDRGSSLGLVNMRERAAMVNGILTISSVCGHGTRVRLVVPTSGP